MSDFSLFGKDLFGADVLQSGGPLARDFTLPPFSVLDARQGPWQERKAAWLSLGIKSETSRTGLLKISDSAHRIAGGYDTPSGERKPGGGVSVFDPTLCELAYRWFAPPGGLVLDPFAGGSVRGIVASLLGLRYVGIELRAEQVTANREQGSLLCKVNEPIWIEGDSRHTSALVNEPADFLFSCPPYGDLERYSEDARDLSTLDYAAFRAAYREIIAASCGALRQDRFACFVVGEIRGKDGHYRNFVGDTVAAFADAGLRFYNEAILVTALGTVPVRVSRSFPAGRKLGKTHQNVLVFVKGDWRKAAAACGSVEGSDAA